MSGLHCALAVNFLNMSWMDDEIALELDLKTNRPSEAPQRAFYHVTPKKDYIALAIDMFADTSNVLVPSRRKQEGMLQKNLRDKKMKRGMKISRQLWESMVTASLLHQPVASSILI